MHLESTLPLAAVVLDTGRLERMSAGFAMTQSIHAAAKLGIADLLDARPRTAQELARLAGVHAPPRGAGIPHVTRTQVVSADNPTRPVTADAPRRRIAPSLLNGTDT
jgi:hypothetical protein